MWYLLNHWMQVYLTYWLMVTSWPRHAEVPTTPHLKYSREGLSQSQGFRHLRYLSFYTTLLHNCVMKKFMPHIFHCLSNLLWSTKDVTKQSYSVLIYETWPKWLLMQLMFQPVLRSRGRRLVLWLYPVCAAHRSSALRVQLDPQTVCNDHARRIQDSTACDQKREWTYTRYAVREHCQEIHHVRDHVSTVAIVLHVSEHLKQPFQTILLIVIDMLCIFFLRYLPLWKST